MMLGRSVVDEVPEIASANHKEAERIMLSGSHPHRDYEPDDGDDDNDLE
jgi:hypothetical protein